MLGDGFRAAEQSGDGDRIPLGLLRGQRACRESSEQAGGFCVVIAAL